MRVRVDTTWIAGDPDLGPGKSPPAQIVSWQTGRVIQPDGGAGAAEISFCDRKQTSNQITFLAVREFDTPGELLALLADHGGAEPAYGVECTVSLRTEVDGAWSELELTGVLHLVQTRILGPVSAELTYSAKGGAILVGDTGTYADLRVTDGGDLRITDDGDYRELG